jgi:hypothetical protein
MEKEDGVTEKPFTLTLFHNMNSEIAEYGNCMVSD